MDFYINTSVQTTRLQVCNSTCNCFKKKLVFTSEKTIPDYEYNKTLGSGGFGAVHLYREHRTNRAVAIKAISYKSQGQNYHTVLSEYNIVFNIPHPNIIKYYNSFYNPHLEKCYIVMEYTPFGSLKTIISNIESQGKMFSKTLVLKAIRDILGGVQHLNKNNIVHCDLKPANILIGDGDVFKICDFGAAHYNYDINAPLIGTFIYMAPELFQTNMRPNEKTEVYSIGIILYEMCNLRHPYDMRSISTTRQLVQSVHSKQYPPLASHYGSDMKELLNMMFCVSPYDRQTLSNILRVSILWFGFGD